MYDKFGLFSRRTFLLSKIVSLSGKHTKLST